MASGPLTTAHVAIKIRGIGSIEQKTIRQLLSLSIVIAGAIILAAALSGCQDLQVCRYGPLDLYATEKGLGVARVVHGEVGDSKSRIGSV